MMQNLWISKETTEIIRKAKTEQLVNGLLTKMMVCRDMPRNIPIIVNAAPPEDEEEVLETCRDR
jgi:hypothetical protein